MSITTLVVREGDDVVKAKAIAAQLSLHYHHSWPHGCDYSMAIIAGQCGIASQASWMRHRLSVGCDFLSPLWHYKRSRGKLRHSALVRAMQHASNPRIIDATAGLGGDMMTLFFQGYQVIGIEASPLIHTLLADGLNRYSAASGKASPSLYYSDALAWLKAEEPFPPSILYLDPMFSEGDLKGKPKQSMELFHTLGLAKHDPMDMESLMDWAWHHPSILRIVVKRAARARPLSAHPIHHSYPGQSTRLDVYKG